MGVLVDTNVIVDLLSGDARAVAKIREVEHEFGPPYLSTFVIFETLVAVLFRGSQTKARALESLLAAYPVLPLSAEDARHAAEIRVELLRSGRPSSIPDTLIAGQALAGGHVLVTRDRGLSEAARAVGLTVETF